MLIDPYSACPCGSGKKFKWCCQAISSLIEKAFEQAQQGQMEAAAKTMETLVAENPSNPEAWGRKAQLEYLTGKIEQAETTLQKAFEINPNYPYGLLLQAIFRRQEGELVGSLMLLRKGADAYDPEARDQLATIYQMIADCERVMNRTVAARAALRIALRLNPDPDLQKAFDADYGPESPTPPAARKDYVFLLCPASASTESKQAWQKALTGADTGKLSDTAKAFEQLTMAEADNAAAWYNLALARAWLGDNQKAVDALNRYIDLEADDARAAEAWTLAEVLLLGRGLESSSDYKSYSAIFQIRDPQPVVQLLGEWDRMQRLVGIHVREGENFLTGMLVEAPPVLLAGTLPNQPLKYAGSLMVVEAMLRIWGSNQDALERVRGELKQRLGIAITEQRQETGPAHFGDILMDAMIFPAGATTQEEATQRVAEHVKKYFEDGWIHRPLRALGNVAPIDAAGHRSLRKKLHGIIQFLQDCGTVSVGEMYDFDQLRRRLGLLNGSAAPPSSPATAAVDISSMGAVELANLPIEGLTDEQLEQACQAAHKLDAREIAGKLMRALVARPPRPDHGDRYLWFARLIQYALGEGDTQAALDLVNEGEKQDCEHNEGLKRNDFELLRGQILTKRGEVDQAAEVFQRLLDRSPGEARYCGAATEAMLSARQGAMALKFAEFGLKKAREQNNRDSEQYFLELAAAAKKIA